MPIDRKSKAKAREAASKYAGKQVGSAISKLMCHPVHQRASFTEYLIDAYMRGYERAKREARNAK